VGVIPSRWASTRLPGKSLVPLCGKPLVQWVAESVSCAERLSEVLVATDDKRIADVVEGFGGKAVMTRQDHPSGTDRVAEAVAQVDAEVVINIQGDEPMIDPALIDRLADVMLADRDLDMATAATPILDVADVDNPAVVKVVCDGDSRALYFSRSPIPFVRDDDMSWKGLYRRHIGIYAYRRRFLETLVSAPPCVLERAEKLEQLRALHLGARMAVVETDDVGVGVDTPDDVVRVEELLRMRGMA